MIEVRDLTKDYWMGEELVRALDHVSLRIGKGEFVAIMGASGSGKSTLLNVLGCLDQPTSGSYKLRDHEVAGMNDDQLADIRNREIGFIFQTFNLLPRMNAVANVALPLIYARIQKQERIRRSEEMLTMVGLGNRMDHRPSEMSGGQRQRVAIARALINKPGIILADEPTGNLDSSTSGEIMELLANLHKSGHTIILVTHEPEIAEYAQRTIVMKDGQAVSG